MVKTDLLEIWEHPEQVTEEGYRGCSRRDQFMILLVRPEFRDLFLEFHGSFSVREEVELILNHMLACEDAAHKDKFTGHDIAKFIIEGVLRVAEFGKMCYAERLNGHDWSGILAETDPDGVWKEYCDFSKFDNADWVNLLTYNPEYADRCPFEKLEQTDIDVLLREQPELAEKCGVKDAVSLYLVNEAPCEAGESDFPFYPPIPAGFPRDALSVWLRSSFPEMTWDDVARYVYRVCFHEMTRIGVCSRAGAEEKMAALAPGLEKMKHLRLRIGKPCHQ